MRQSCFRFWGLRQSFFRTLFLIPWFLSFTALAGEIPSRYKLFLGSVDTIHPEKNQAVVRIRGDEITLQIPEEISARLGENLSQKLEAIRIGQLDAVLAPGVWLVYPNRSDHVYYRVRLDSSIMIPHEAKVEKLFPINVFSSFIPEESGNSMSIEEPDIQKLKELTLEKFLRKKGYEPKTLRSNRGWIRRLLSVRSNCSGLLSTVANFSPF